MFEILIHIYLVAVAFAFGCGLLSFSRSGSRLFRQFTVFLGVTLLVEVAVNIVFHWAHVRGRYRNGVYNIFSLVEMLFYAYYFYRITESQFVRKIQLAFLLLFPPVWAWLVFDRTGILAFHGTAITVGGLFIVCFATHHLYELSAHLRSHNIFRVPNFWIATALMLFYCCQAPFMGSVTYLAAHHRELSMSLLNVSVIINTLMYLMFGYAFLCQKGKS